MPALRKKQWPEHTKGTEWTSFNRMQWKQGVHLHQTGLFSCNSQLFCIKKKRKIETDRQGEREWERESEWERERERERERSHLSYVLYGSHLNNTYRYVIAITVMITVFSPPLCMCIFILLAVGATCAKRGWNLWFPLCTAISVLSQWAHKDRPCSDESAQALVSHIKSIPCQLLLLITVRHAWIFRSCLPS